MDGRQNLEAVAALALLPIGGIVALLSAFAFVPLGFAAILLPFFADGPNWGWLELWLVAASLIAVRTMIGGIETMSALDWRTALVTLALIAVVVAACPIWWLGGLRGAL